METEGQKYESLYRDMKERLRRGEWKPGERLPSKRVTADRFRCSLTTVERAYGMLADEGYLCPRERRGYFVAEGEALFPAADGGGETVYLPEPQASPAQDFPYSVWFRTVRRVLSEQGEQLFVKSPGKGCAVLRNAIARHLGRYRGMRVQPADLVIGSGAEQLYESAVRLLGRERVFGIEDPSYGQIRSVYEGLGVRVRLLPMGAGGIESGALRRGDFDVLHVTPYHSYPSGVSTSMAKKLEYLRWAEGAGRYLLEDDFDSEFAAPGHAAEPLYTLDRTGSVIYLNTFSKSLSPAVRIGYMILPPPLMAVYDEVLGGFSCSVPVMDQYVLAAFIAGGHFERHLDHLRRVAKKEQEKQTRPF